MKHSHGDETVSGNCPCASCMYTDESYRPAVDDLRTTQKLSHNNVISEKTGKKTRKNLSLTRRGRELDDDEAERSSVIKKLVHLEGKYLSCCRGGSKVPHRGHEGSVHRHCPSIIFGHRAKDERHTGKHIRSDPCTCIPNTRGNMESKAMIKNVHGTLKTEPKFEPQLDKNWLTYQRKYKGYKLKQSGMGETMRNIFKKNLQTRIPINGDCPKTCNCGKLPVLPPYECEPMLCTPGECHPIECEKIFYKREKPNYALTNTKNTNLKTISTPNSVSSSESECLEAYKPDKIENARPSQHGHNCINQAKLPKQAVRSSSSFNFNIEFYNDERGENNLYEKSENTDTRPTLKIEKSKRDKALNKPIGHKPSQNTKVGKFKYSTKRYLQRCFCTIKLSKQEPKINKIRPYSTGTLKSGGQSIPTSTIIQKPKLMNETTKKRERKSNMKNTLLPRGLNYEDEPGKCAVSGGCYRCEYLELTNKRKQTKTCTGQSGKKCKTKLTFISRKRNMHMKTVNLHSIKSSQKRFSKVKRVVKEKPVKTVKAPIKTNVTKPTRQVLPIIDSSFGVNVEYCKDDLFYHEMIHMPTDLISKSQQRKPNKSLTVEKDKNFKQKCIHNSIHHKEFQVEVPAQDIKPTKTGSFINSFFRTAELQNRKELHHTEKGNVIKASLTFMKNSLHVFQCLTTVNKQKSNKADTTGFIQIKQKNQERCASGYRPINVEPCLYDEGLSDPRVYEERIRKRKSNQHEISSTEVPEGRALSTQLQSAKTSKYTQNKNKNINLEVKPVPKKAVKSVELFKITQKGMQSNMSNTEAPRERNISTMTSKPARCCANTRVKEIDLKPKIEKKKVKVRKVRHNQEKFCVEKRDSNASGLKQAMKRCFCTFQKGGKMDENPKKKPVKMKDSSETAKLKKKHNASATVDMSQSRKIQTPAEKAKATSPKAICSKAYETNKAGCDLSPIGQETKATRLENFVCTCMQLFSKRQHEYTKPVSKKNKRNDDETRDDKVATEAQKTKIIPFYYECSTEIQNRTCPKSKYYTPPKPKKKVKTAAQKLAEKKKQVKIPFSYECGSEGQSVTCPKSKYYISPETVISEEQPKKLKKSTAKTKVLKKGVVFPGDNELSGDVQNETTSPKPKSNSVAQSIRKTKESKKLKKRPPETIVLEKTPPGTKVLNKGGIKRGFSECASDVPNIDFTSQKPNSVICSSFEETKKKPCPGTKHVLKNKRKRTGFCQCTSAVQKMITRCLPRQGEGKELQIQEMDVNPADVSPFSKKRPWIGVYHGCPGFHPFCLSMHKIWIDFINLMLLLLAAVVWNPFIILVYSFRLFMCCLL